MEQAEFGSRRWSTSEQVRHGHGTGRGGSWDISPKEGGRQGLKKGNGGERSTEAGQRSRWVRNRTKTHAKQEQGGEHRWVRNRVD